MYVKKTFTDDYIIIRCWMNASFTTQVMLTSQRERVNYLNHNLGLLEIL